MYQLFQHTIFRYVDTTVTKINNKNKVFDNVLSTEQ